ncbi:MAG: TetR family transcriptional regulator [Nocardioides sp.]|uniref:TetR family transcriptional regulator n=1 Tax=Nocardioides sp. TaxID=35761 RepID=UPI0039E526AF
MSEGTDPSLGGSRAEGKERTRRAILDATLELTDGLPLAAVSLRQIAKAVGIVPTAFYRHFATMEDLGLTLVDESFVTLRAMLREVRRPEGDPAGVIEMADRSVRILAEHVAAHRRHFAFIARERASSPGPVRDAIRHEIDLCELELAADLARIPGPQSWSNDDLRALSGLIVAMMVTTAEELIAARPEQVGALTEVARRQLRMIVVGAIHWNP